MVRRYPILLLVDDSAAFREFARYSIKSDIKFINIIEAKSGLEGLQLYRQYLPDVVLLDWKMPGIDGMKTLELMSKHDKNIKIIMTTAYTEDQKLLDDMMEIGAFSFVPKPMNRVNLLKVISDALRVRKNEGYFGGIPKVPVM